MRKVDLHNHLGRDGANPGFDETIDIAFKKLGEGGIFGICNDGPRDYRYEDFIEQGRGKYERVPLGEGSQAVYVPNKGIIVVGVEEVEPEKGGHFLCVGIPKGEKIRTTNLEKALGRADSLKVGKVIVHPFEHGGFGPYLKNEPEILERFDGFEVYNASAALGNLFPPLGFLANWRATRFYRNNIKNKYNVGAVSFTDGHSVEVIGNSYTLFFAGEINPRAGKENPIPHLTREMRGSRNDNNLTKRPAKWDAFKHVLHMVEHKFKSFRKAS